MDQKLNVVFLSVFPPFKGGISKFSLYLHHHLSRHASILAYNYKKLYPDLLFPGKSQYEKDPDNQQYDALVHTYNPLNWIIAAGKIHKPAPDVFIFSYWHPFIAPATISILRYIKKHKPNILTTGIFHNVVPHEPFPMGQHLTKKLIRRTELPVLLSTQTHNELKELFPDKSSSRLFHPVYSRTLPDASRQNIRRKFGICETDVVFIFFGLIRTYKGLDLFLKALHQISPDRSGIRVIVAGECYINPEPLWASVPDSWRERVTVHNRFIPDREADELLYASDVMVLPYRSASQSGILADAINFELPVICSDQPGFTDIIIDKIHGRIVPSGDITRLAQAITSMTDRSLLSNMRHHIRTLKTELNWDTFSDRFFNAILEAK